MKKLSLIVPLLSILSTIVLGATIQYSVALTSFNAGELSPLMQSRVDFAKYTTGAKTLENMLVRSQGPVCRRPGTKYIATVGDANNPVRLIPFQYSTTDTYIIELGELYARFYRSGAQILDPNTDPYEVVTPWSATDLFELQFDQDAQYMRVVHPDYAPYKITRTAHATWTCAAITFEAGPFLDENDDTAVTLTSDGLTGDVNITASSAVFDSDHVGALFQISHILDSNTVTTWFYQVLAADANSETVPVQKGQYFDVTTGGVWWGG